MWILLLYFLAVTWMCLRDHNVCGPIKLQMPSDTHSVAYAKMYAFHFLLLLLFQLFVSLSYTMSFGFHIGSCFRSFATTGKSDIVCCIVWFWMEHENVWGSCVSLTQIQFICSKTWLFVLVWICFLGVHQNRIGVVLDFEVLTSPIRLEFETHFLKTKKY